jgi:hypothetical protein
LAVNIHCMKNRLNITIKDTLLEQTKKYASKHNTSVSQLVEQYFMRLTRPAAKKNILQVLQDLPKSRVKKDGDLKAKYYQEQKKKYGF